MRRDALAIFQAALTAANPRVSTLKSLRKLKLSLDHFDRTFLIATGKAAISMAASVEQFIGKRLTGGIALTKYGHVSGPLRVVKIMQAAHPIPDTAGLRASEQIEQLLRTLNARDLLITAISGGSSALLTAPAAGISLPDKQRTTELLLKAGADIFELNTVRKHLSRLKGGQMASLAYPATTVSLLLSDVVGDRIDVIGSGPTAPDNSTFQQARDVLEKFGLTRRVPLSVRRRLEAASEETPKPDNSIFKHVKHIITVSNRQALAAAAAKARALGYRPFILTSSLQGEAREVARVHAAILRDAPAGSCILSGGETTVTVTGKGKGGRNQEFALALAIDIAGVSDIAALCAGTDGTDGPTDAAGAFVTGGTANKIAAARQHLADNNSYDFLRPLNALIKTGPTGTNVMDINILLSAQKK